MNTGFMYNMGEKNSLVWKVGCLWQNPSRYHLLAMLVGKCSSGSNSSSSSAAPLGKENNHPYCHRCSRQNPKGLSEIDKLTVEQLQQATL